MYKVILVDDEELILERLKCCISWEKYGFSLAGTFSQAQEALDFLEKSKADLFITDVKMPGMSGLDLIREVRSRDKNIKAIIISGYSEFEYARQALQYGASAYILKPTDDAMVCGALAKIKEELDQHYAAEFWPENQKVLLESIFREIVFNRNYENAGFLKDYLQGNFQYLYAVRTERLKLFAVDTPDSLETVRPDHYFGSCRYISIRHENLNITLLSLQARAGREDVAGYFSRIKQSCEEHQESHLAGIWEGPLPQGVNLQAVFQKMLRQFNYTFYSSAGWITIPDQVWLNPADADLNQIMDLPGLARRIILEADEQKTNQAVQDLVGILRNHYVPDPVIRDIPRRLCHELLACIFERDGKSLPAQIKSMELYSDGSDLFTFDGLYHRLVSMITRIKSEYYSRLGNYESILANLARRYIQDNFSQDIMLEDIARHLSVSISSLCHIFKRISGTSLIQYLIDYRLEKASADIQKTDSPVYVIAEKMGYKDTRYFIKLFKKRYGISPTEMRRYAKDSADPRQSQPVPDEQDGGRPEA